VVVANSLRSSVVYPFFKAKLKFNMEEGQEQQPQWVPEAFAQGFFANLVATPLVTPQLFHPVLAPAPSVLGVHARTGLYAAEAIRHLCELRDLACEVYKVEPGHTERALDHIERRARETGEADLQCVLVVDRADVLIHEPDNERALLRAATQLHRSCEHSGLLLVLVLNCSRAERDPGVAPWLRHARETFYSQLSAAAHFQAPDSAFRARWFEWAMRELVERHLGRALALGPEEYRQLADHATYATIADMLRWLRERVFTPMLFENAEPVDLDYLVERMPNTLGAKHVCAYDARAVEAAYAESVSLTTAALPFPKRARPKYVDLHLEKEEEEAGAAPDGGAQEGAAPQEGGAPKRTKVGSE
jgi:hypothetical protein